MLDNKFGEKAKTDIKSLSLEGAEKREEKWFDAARDLSEADISAMKEVLESIRSFSIWDSLTEQAANMKVLGLVPQITNQDYECMQQELKQFRDSQQWIRFAAMAANMRELGMTIGLTGNDRYQILRELETTQVDSRDFSLVSTASYRLGLIRELPESKKAELSTYVDGLLGRGSFFDICMLTAANARLFGVEPRLKLNESTRKIMKRNLQYFRENNRITFTAVAASLAILSADEARITPDGKIQLSDKSKPKIGQVTPLLPDQRNF